MESLARKFLLFLALLGLLLHARAKAQSSAAPTYRLGTSVAARLQSRSVNLEFLPTLGIVRSRHAINLGPTLLLPTVEQKGIKLTGVKLGYNYALLPGSLLRPQLSGQLLAQRKQENWTRNNWLNEGYVDMPGKSVEHYTAALLGLEITPVISSHLRLELGIFSGIYLAAWKDKSGGANPEFYVYTPYDNFGLTYRASLGCSYRLN